MNPGWIHTSLYCTCKDHRNDIEAPNSVVKDLISYKIMTQFDKIARLTYGTEFPYRESALLFYQMDPLY